MANRRRNTLDLYPLANGANPTVGDTAYGGDQFAAVAGTATLASYDTSVKLDPRSRGSLKVDSTTTATRAFVYGNFDTTGVPSMSFEFLFAVGQVVAATNNHAIVYNAAGSVMLRLGRTSTGAIRIASAADTAYTVTAFTPANNTAYRCKVRVATGTTGTGATGDGAVSVELWTMAGVLAWSFTTTTGNTGTSPARNIQVGKLTATANASTFWFANFVAETELAGFVSSYDRPAVGDYDIIVGTGASNMVGRATDEGAIDTYSDRVYVYSQHGADQDSIQSAKEYLRHPDTSEGLSPFNTFVADYVATRLTTGRKVLIVPVAYGGTGFTVPDSNGNSMTWRPDAAADANNRFLFAVNKTNDALAAAGSGSAVKAILHNAGSTDGSNNTPKETFRGYFYAFINALRTQLGSTIPFLMMQSRPDLMVAETRHRIIDEVQQETVAAKPYTGYAYSPTATDTRMPDAVHFNAKGVRIIGHSLFDVLDDAEANTTSPIPISGTLSATVALSASAVPAVASAASLSASVALAGTASPVGVGAGSLGVSVALTGSAVPVSVTAGTLTATVALTGLVGTTPSAAGQLATTVALSGTALPSVSKTGTLQVNLSIAGTIQEEPTMAVLTATIDDFTSLGATPAHRSMLRFRTDRFDPNTGLSARQWDVPVDETGELTTGLPNLSPGVLLLLSSAQTIPGFPLSVAVTGYPSSITLTELLTATNPDGTLKYVVDPASQEPLVPLPPSASDILAQAGQARDDAQLEANSAAASKVQAASSASSAGTAASTAQSAATAAQTAVASVPVTIAETTAPPTSAFQDILGRIRTAAQDVSILIYSDSTAQMNTNADGSTSLSWARLLPARLAALFPTHSIAFHQWIVGTPGAYDPAVTIAGTGPRTIHIWNGSIASQTWEYHFDISRREALIVAPNPDLVIFSLGHNENYTLANVNNMQSARGKAIVYIEAVRGLLPSAAIVISSQNPLTAAGRENATAFRTDLYRRTALERGYGFIDINRAFIADGRPINELVFSDGIHPTQAGHVAWVNEVMRHFVSLSTSQVIPPATPAFFTALRNLLPNPSFTDFTPPTLPTGWTQAVGTSTPTKNTTIFETGTYALQLDKASAVGSDLRADLPFNLVKGQWVTFAVRMYIPTGAPSGAGRIGIQQGGGGTVYSDIWAGTRDQWFWRMVTSKIATTSTYARVLLGIDTSTAAASTVIVDRVVGVLGTYPSDLGS